MLRYKHFFGFCSTLFVTFVVSVCVFSLTYADVTTGILGHWTFDAANMSDGVALDSSGNARHGNLVNIATSTFYTSGQIKEAFNFDGSNDYVNAGSAISLDSSNWTLSIWLNPTATALTSYRRPFSYYGNGPTIWFYSAVSLSIVHGGTVDFTCSGATMVADKWHHIVFTRSGSTITCYLDNVQKGSNTSFSATYTADSQVRIGGSSAFGEHYPGKLDDARIYSRGLSAGDVAELYRLGFTPTVTTAAASSVTDTSATLNGSIDVDLASSTTRGFAYGTSATLDTVVATTSESGTFGIGSYTSDISSLTQNTTYYVRAYASNATSTGYGSIQSFTTDVSVLPPTLTTSAPTSVATSTLTLNASITATGGADATQSGFAYGTSATLETVIATSTLGSQTGTASFSESLSSLSPNTTYYFRPYATNSAGIGYGSIQSTTTIATVVPTVVTGAASSVADTTATGNGTISATGYVNPTVRGFVYGTTIAYGATTTEAGDFQEGSFTASLSSLSCNTLYYIRAYATNSVGTSYGSEQTFTTNPCLPTVITSAATSVATSSAVLNANMTSDGNASSTVRGFAYGLTTAYGATTTESGTFGVGTFSTTSSDLSPNTTYHVRAYATNPAGVGYGSDVTFTTAMAAPTVTTGTPTSVATSTATLNGTVDATGGEAATQHGFAYGTSATLETVIATSTLGVKSGTGSFAEGITGLSPNTTYYVRAYSVNSVGTSTGTIQSFSTSATIPTLTTSAPTSVATSTLTLNASITATGGADATQSGFAYGTSATLETVIATSTLGSQTGTASFSESLSSLSPNTTYYFRPYATNSAGIGYGSIQSTTTIATVVPTVVTDGASGVTDSIATLNGDIESIGNDTVTSRGFEWGSSTAYGATTTNIGLYNTGAFTNSLSALICNTTYHVRAYAVNGVGIGYGDDVTFTTQTCPVAESSSGGGTRITPPAPRAPEGGYTFYISPNPTSVGYVTLHFNGGFDTTRIAISSDAAFSSPTYIDYVPSRFWVLTGEAGNKTVYARFCNQYNRCSESVSASVMYAPISRTVDESIDTVSVSEEPLQVSPAEVVVTESIPTPLQGEWDLLSYSLTNNFVLAPLPSDIAELTIKFPELNQVFTDLGITTIADLDKLADTTINLPAFASEQEIPTEILIAHGDRGEIPLESSIMLTPQGDVEQKISTVAGKPIVLSVKPESDVDRIEGYLLFKRRPTQALLEVPARSQVAAAVLFDIRDVGASKDQAIEPELLIQTFTYTDPDNDGIYTAKITAPVSGGEYEILTVIDYKDAEKGTRELRMVTLIDPEGYVYKVKDGEEVRVSGATVTIWEASNSLVWDAKKYKQENPQVTGKTGAYSFLVPKGQYYITATAKGYKPYTSDIFTVAKGKEVHFNIEMEEDGSLVGALMDWRMIVILIFGIALIVNFIRNRHLERRVSIK